jgi:hypothetical protein
MALQFAIVELSTGKILFRYESIVADYGRFGGVLGDRSVVFHAAMPVDGLQDYYVLYNFEKQEFRLPTNGTTTAEEAAIRILKQKRNMLLAETDYLFLTDVDTTVIPKKLKDEYVKYRTRLRAMFKVKMKAADVVFPTKPADP